MSARRIIRHLRLLFDVDDTNRAAGKILEVDVDGATHVYVDKPVPGGGGAPTTIDFLVGTADATLTNEIVVGPTPGGELGGTWAAPTVDAVHSGSSHAATQAAAEATAAAALAAHVAVDVIDGDTAGGVLSGTYPNPGFAADMATQAELDAHEADTSNVHGIADTSALALTANHPTNATFNDHSARHENGGPDEISIAGLDGTSTELANHLADATDAHDASAVSVDSTSLSGTAIHVQGSLEELDNLLDDHSSRHENGGADEISVAGLSGELADAQPVTVRKNTGADVGTRSRLNFIEGTNVTLTIADDGGSDEVDITIAASGSASVSYDDEDLILHARSLG